MQRSFKCYFTRVKVHSALYAEHPVYEEIVCEEMDDVIERGNSIISRDETIENDKLKAGKDPGNDQLIN